MPLGATVMCVTVYLVKQSLYVRVSNAGRVRAVCMDMCVGLLNVSFV